MTPYQAIASAAGVVALALAVTAPASATPAATPKVERVTDRYGTVRDVQVLSPSPDEPAIRPLTIAERYALWSGAGRESVGSTRVSMLCPVLPNGAVSFDCTAEGFDADGPTAAIAKDLLYYAHPSFTPFAAIEASAENGPWRSVRFGVDIDPATRPALDLDNGEFVDSALLGPLFKITAGDYPARAMRYNAQGTLSVECQVQTDYSLICRTTSANPPEFSGYFSRWAEHRSREVRMPATLPDGRPTVGLRTRFPVRFQN